MDARATEQLAALARVDKALDESGIAHWLFGGWAVDFYAGSQTRVHDDVDLAVWLDDLPRIVKLLEDDDWRHAPAEEEDGGTGYERGAVRLELTYLVRDDEGRVFVPLRHGPAWWPDDALADDVRELQGVRSRLVSLAYLIAEKSRPREDPDDAAKDLADFDRLSQLGARGSGA